MATTLSVHLNLAATPGAANWNGKPLLLKVRDTAQMAATTNGSMVFAYQNMAPTNSAGTLSLVSGGLQPEALVAPALTGAPLWRIRNWHGNNLGVTNASIVTVPIRIQAVGPGIPGSIPKNITIGTPLVLPPGECAHAQLKPAAMQFVFSSPDYTATFALIGGPPDGNGNNAYTFTVNAKSSTVMPAGDTPPPGDYATTADTFEFPVNWGSDWVFIANLSGETSEGNSILITKL